ncbi:hypothetical protein [Candidatus Halobonum tyrrellensis]|uniref:Transcription anti-termination factor n=1 Tax=Candidatus Halobonum tyrrellensis G22 TaxID=1324957 RepID=V4HCX5_9EURY|nr:hypothetical protein [Candidatus Halobonum tyrrellensis]ESP88575.1 transcription anti-termination factor [Candidatus Halobonum tyrrellensis G22]
MDAATFRDRLETEKATELDRLGSNKSLVALTDAALEAGVVLRAAADSEHAAHVTFSGWAADADGGGDADGSGDGARDLFAWVADREATHRDRVVDSLAALDDGADYEPSDGGDGGPMHAYLRERADPIERVAAGLVGRPLVSVRSHVQVVSFFVNEADETRADLFRELRAETEEELDRGLAYLDDHCEGDDWERARMVAEYTVQLAYDDYADALGRLGIDVKPVC